MQDYEPYIRSLVLRLLNRCGKQYSNDIEDLWQEARIAFLKHLRKMDNLAQTQACTMDVLNAVWDYWVEMAFICIPRRRYHQEIQNIQRVSFDQSSIPERMIPESEITFGAELDDFLSSLTPQECTVVRMKLDECTNRAIMPHAGITNEAQMSRIMKRIREKAEAYFSQ